MDSKSKNGSMNKVTCIQLSGAFPDIGSKLIIPDYGMSLIGTILSESGYDVRVYMERIKPPEWDYIATSNIICMSTLSPAASKAYRLAKKIRLELKIPIIFGGTHATYFPESCLEYCDYVVLKEGDETIVELCDAILKGRDVSNIPGIAYKNNGQVFYTSDRPRSATFNTIPDFSLIKGYKKLSFFDTILQRRFLVPPIQTSRGCTFSCKHCIVDTMFSRGYRVRNIESVIQDLKDKRKYSQQLIFVDNNFAAKPSYAKKLLKRMIEEKLGLDILVLTRIDVARDDELLTLMRKAGVTRLYQGYESIQPETLSGFDKQHSVEKIVNATNKLHSYGFCLYGSFIIGADTDTLDTIHSTVQFVLDQNIGIAYFFPLLGYFTEEKNNNRPLTPWHRIIFKDWAFFNGNFVTHFPLQMRPSELQIGLINAHRKVFSLFSITNSLKQRNYGYVWGKIFHRWTRFKVDKFMLEYVPWLREIEHGLYDENGRLLEDQLKERIHCGSWPTFPLHLRNSNNGTISNFEIPIGSESKNAFT